MSIKTEATEAFAKLQGDTEGFDQLIEERGNWWKPMSYEFLGSRPMLASWAPFEKVAESIEFLEVLRGLLERNSRWIESNRYHQQVALIDESLLPLYRLNYWEAADRVHQQRSLPENSLAPSVAQ